MKTWKQVAEEFRGRANEDPHPIDSRPLHAGVKDTDYGTLRKACESVAKNDYTNGTEKGLAESLLAVIADFENYIQEHGDDPTP